MYHVLVADDERLEREALQFVLQQLDDLVADVTLAANGREAIEFAERFSPDIAIIDIKMPGINGIEAARRIKAIRPGCHIVFLTAFNYFDYAQEAIRLRADDFIIKPASNRDIEAVIQTVGRRLAGERPAPVNPDHESDERDLAESKLIGDAVLGHVDESLLRRYLQIDDDGDPPTTAVVLRVTPIDGPFAPKTSEHDRLFRRRVLALLRSECAGRGQKLLASAESSSIYALLVGNAKDGVEQIAGSHQSIVSGVSAVAERNLGVRVSTGIKGPAPGFSRLGLRFANAKMANRTVDGTGANSRDRAARTPADERSARRAMLDAEQNMVRALLAGNHKDLVSLSTELFCAVKAAVRRSMLREELTEALTYVAHATAMQLGRLPGDVGVLIRELSDSLEEPTERDLLLAAGAIAERLSRHAAEARESMHYAVAAAREYIDLNFAADLSLDHIAGHVRLSPFHLSRIFKSATGTTVLDYLTNRRIEESKVLMRESLLSIKEIAARVGYGDQNYFSRVFRRMTGVTPSAYRQMRAEGDGQ